MRTRILAEKFGVAVDVEMRKTAVIFPSIVGTLTLGLFTLI
jgi:hypothetical protein